ncbi:MAG: hypothetical protein ACO3C5_03840 [Ilumatobacteraceae bacterium]
MQPRSSLFVLGLVIAGVSCGSDTEQSVETAAIVDTVANDPGTTTPPDSTEAESTEAPSTTTDGIVRISVTVGVDSGPERVEEVSVGDSIELTMVNPDEDDEFHVHGFDLGGDETPAGDEKVFAFTASEAGDFEVESHATGDVLVVIRVS